MPEKRAVVATVDRTWDGEVLSPSARTTVTLGVKDDALHVVFDAPFFRDPPPDAPVGWTDRLWEHEVAELFVAADDAYLELEVGPFGHHWLASFEGPRRRSPATPLARSVRVHRRGSRWTGAVELPLSALPAEPRAILAAAIAGPPTARRHFISGALPGATPDFHQPAHFPRLDAGFQTRLRRRAAARAPDPAPTLWLLVGPKGSGKTTLSRMITTFVDAVIVPAERIAQRLRGEWSGPMDEDYAHHVLTAVGDATLEAGASRSLVLLESTASSVHTQTLVERVATCMDVRWLRVRASAATCTSRIAARPSTDQVPVPPDLIERMHAQTEAFTAPWDVELDNDDPPLDVDALKSRLTPLLSDVPRPAG